MEIKIEGDESTMTIDSEHLDNDNFVDIVIKTENSEISDTYLIEDIYLALGAFLKKRELGRKADKLLRN